VAVMSRFVVALSFFEARKQLRAQRRRKCLHFESGVGTKAV
jgi:hypothetical protein